MNAEQALNMCKSIDRRPGTEAFWNEVTDRLMFNEPEIKKIPDGFEIHLTSNFFRLLRRSGNYQAIRWSPFLRINDWTPIADEAKAREVFKRILDRLRAVNDMSTLTTH